MHQTHLKISGLFKNKYLYIALFLLSPLIVYFDVLLLNYTISTNEASANLEQQLGKVLPISDPVAGSLQDHPWLSKIGHSLRQFTIPLINLDNGLGAPLLESLQSGVFYPLNILLVCLDLSSPQFFDIFCVLHILILLVNSFLLLKLYVRWECALILALAFTFSWLTFLSVNMVHYRSFVWAPLIAWAAIKTARAECSITTTSVGIGAIVLSVTAGNPQESFFDLIAAGVFFGAESFVSRKFSWQTSLLVFVGLIAGVLIAAPSVLPYLTSKSQGLLTSVESPDRSSIVVNSPWLWGWIIQYINGSYLHFYREMSASGDDYSVFAAHPLFIFLAIAGIFVVLLDRKSSSGKKILFCIFLSVALLGVINTSQFNPIRGLLNQIPFINTLRFPKYIQYIHLLIAVSAAISLSLLLEIPFKKRRELALGAFGLVIVLAIVVIGFNQHDPGWRFNYHKLDQMLMIWGGSILSIVACLALLLTSKNVLRWQPFFSLMLLVSLLIKPYGFFGQFPKHLPFPVNGLDLSQERILSFADSANSNLLRDYERTGVFDPVSNKSFFLFMLENFKLISSLHIEPLKQEILTQKQVDLLRLMGVTSTYGYQIETGTNITRLNSDLIKVNNPLPKVFVLRSPGQVQTSCQQKDYSKALKQIEATIASRPVNGVRKGVNDLQFELNRSASGTLVSLQAFSPGWQWGGIPATNFCNAFNAWQGEFETNKSYTLKYVPPGLRRSYAVALVGILLMLVAVGLSRRKAEQREIRREE